MRRPCSHFPYFSPLITPIIIKSLSLFFLRRRYTHINLNIPANFLSFFLSFFFFFLFFFFSLSLFLSSPFLFLSLPRFPRYSRTRSHTCTHSYIYIHTRHTRNSDPPDILEHARHIRSVLIKFY